MAGSKPKRYLIIAAVFILTNCSAMDTMQLISASSSGQTDTVKRLLDKGVSINAKDLYGNTALLTAAREGRIDTVRLLISRGADVNVKNNNSDTPLALAEKNGHKEISELLKKRGAR